MISFDSIDYKDFETIVDGQSHEFSLIRTSGQEEEDKLRPLAYNNAKVFIITYSVDGAKSFENILNKWLPELQKIPEWPIPFILVGSYF